MMRLVNLLLIPDAPMVAIGRAVLDVKDGAAPDAVQWHGRIFCRFDPGPTCGLYAYYESTRYLGQVTILRRVTIEPGTPVMRSSVGHDDLDDLDDLAAALRDPDRLGFRQGYRPTPSEIAADLGAKVTGASSRTFESELTSLINRYSKENGSGTPDYVLAGYLTKCLEVFTMTVRARDQQSRMRPLVMTP